MTSLLIIFPHQNGLMISEHYPPRPQPGLPRSIESDHVMKRDLVRCTACLYIMDSKHLREVCPACTAPAQAFKAFSPRIQGKRAAILDLQLHARIVQLPQAFALIFVVLSFLFLCLCPCSRFNLRVIETLKMLSFAYPFVVFAGMISGMIDAKNRFLTLSTPALRLKIILGGAFLLFATAIPLSFALLPFAPLSLRILLFFLSLCALLASLLLGKIGRGLKGTGIAD